MCIAFIKVARSNLDKYKLILLNNRDEHLLRPTLPMHWHDGMLSGVDEEDAARGTWLGMNQKGTIGMMLSITQPQSSRDPNAPSRGGIVNEFLRAGDGVRMMETLRESAHEYNGFQLVGFEQNLSGLYYIRTLTNQQVDTIDVCQWDEEYQVISNSPPMKPYKKAQHGLRLLREKLQDSNNQSVEQIFDSLMEIAKDSTRCYPDPQLQLQTENTDEYNVPLSSIFIKYPDGTRQYGTRCHTLLTVDSDDKVNILERRLAPEESTWHDTTFEFVLTTR